DCLILLSDIKGVLDENGERIALVRDVADVPDRGSPDQVGRGGIASKLDAAHKARRSGALVVIADAGQPGIVAQVLAGEDVGTCFSPVGQTLRARQHWILYTLRPRGTILVDAGAARALTERGSSLLPIGVVGIRGDFRRGDAVRIVSPDGTEV